MLLPWHLNWREVCIRNAGLFNGLSTCTSHLMFRHLSHALSLARPSPPTRTHSVKTQCTPVLLHNAKPATTRTCPSDAFLPKQCTARPRAAFPATFEAAADVSGARQAHPSPQLDQALASLWLRSVLCAGLLTAAVRALQSRAHLRAAYTSDALALAPEALATGRAVEAELAALQGAAAALRPNARELESLGELRNAAAQGRWDAAAAEAVVEEEFSWQGVLDGGAAPKEGGLPVRHTDFLFRRRLACSTLTKTPRCRPRPSY